MLFDAMQDRVKDILPKIITLPFNQELAAGSLPREKFSFYLQQDALYLADFTRALSLTAARLSHTPHSQQFLRFATEAIQAERELHQKHLSKYQTQPLSSHEQSPACFMYTNFLIKTASTAAAEEAVASLLPCFWVYREVGKYMAQEVQQATNHPYYDWITLYSGEQFDHSVNAAITITNELVQLASNAVKEKMTAAFFRSTQLEWLFWDSAYKQEMWCI